MFQYRKILVAFDGSPAATGALIRTMRLTATTNSPVTVVTVAPSCSDIDDVCSANADSSFLERGKNILSSAETVATTEGGALSTVLAQGEAYESIVTTADQQDCDLIVMGRKGLSRLERAFMGSVTARVIGHTKRDVLVLPEGAGLHCGLALLATDGSTASIAAEKRAFLLARHEGIRLIALSSVYANDEFSSLAPELLEELEKDCRGILNGAAARAGGQDIRLETAIRRGEPHTAIRELAAERAVDLIVMGSHGRKGLSRLLMGSVTERVIANATCPVLVCHD